MPTSSPPRSLVIPRRPPRSPGLDLRADPDVGPDLGVAPGRPTIPPFRLVAEPLDDAAAALPGFIWAGPEVGRRHRLGGAPPSLPRADHPHCPTCGCTMTFYAQLDSLNDEILLGDAGFLYVFVCFDCHTSTSLIHSV